MTSLVSVDCRTGELARYETNPPHIRRTHSAIPNGGPTELTAGLIESFRVQPPEEFRDGPEPPSPPAAIMVLIS